MEQQDIFIAYHGTYDDLGSLGKARELYYFLQSSGVNCYFFPNESNAYFANTPLAAQKSDKFIFLCAIPMLRSMLMVPYKTMVFYKK